jgi:hypothetical protein
MPPSSEKPGPKIVIIESKTFDVSLDFAQRMGNRDGKVELGSKRSISRDRFSIEIKKGTLEDFRNMIKGVASLKIIEKNKEKKKPEKPKVPPVISVSPTLSKEIINENGEVEVEVDMSSYLPGDLTKPEKR